MAPRRKYETQPKIDLALFERQGLFDAHGPKWGVGFRSAGMRTIAIARWHSPTQCSVTLFFAADDPSDGSDHFGRQEIEIGVERRKDGPRRYFVCPAKGTRCRELHFYKGRFVSRRAVPGLNPDKPSVTHRREVKLIRMRERLLGLDGKAPARGEVRDRILATFQQIPFVLIQWPDLKPLFEAQDQMRQRRRRRIARREYTTDAQDTRLALWDGGRAGLKYNLVGYLSHSPSEYLETAAPQKDRFLNAPLERIDGRPSLDLRVLAKKWVIDDTATWSSPILWPSLWGLLIVDFRDPAQPFLWLGSLQTPQGRQLPEQIIRLVPSAHKGRWYMECPLSGRRCEILFFRDGVFASPKAARLVHGSQRSLSFASLTG